MVVLGGVANLYERGNPVRDGMNEAGAGGGGSPLREGGTGVPRL